MSWRDPVYEEMRHDYDPVDDDRPTRAELAAEDAEIARERRQRMKGPIVDGWERLPKVRKL